MLIAQVCHRMPIVMLGRRSRCGPPLLSTGAYLTLDRDLSTSGYFTFDGMSSALTSAGLAITAGDLDVGNGAVLSLDQNLSLTNGSLYLYSGGSIARTTQAISAPSFFIEHATLDLLAGDTFDPTKTSTMSGGLVNAAGILERQLRRSSNAVTLS